MLKYVDAKVVFAEIPDEITLAINISNCQVKCPLCHSKYLWQDEGTLLIIPNLIKIIKDNKGITCVCFMGEGNSPMWINKLAEYIKDNQENFGKLKVGYYTGREKVPEEIKLENFDYIKIGSFNGYPLNDKRTNQRMYSVVHTSLGLSVIDITKRFWKHETENQSKSIG